MLSSNVGGRGWCGGKCKKGGPVWGQIGFEP